MTESRRLLQHFLAALAYRSQKALRHAPPAFADYRAAPAARISDEQFLHGPLADAMTHVGQLAFLRRLYGDPVPPENFIFADIDSANVGELQALPNAPDPGWSPGQMSRAPGPLREPRDADD